MDAHGHVQQKKCCSVLWLQLVLQLQLSLCIMRTRPLQDPTVSVFPVVQSVLRPPPHRLLLLPPPQMARLRLQLLKGLQLVPVVGSRLKTQEQPWTTTVLEMQMSVKMVGKLELEQEGEVVDRDADPLLLQLPVQHRLVQLLPQAVVGHLEPLVRVQLLQQQVVVLLLVHQLHLQLWQ